MSYKAAAAIAGRPRSRPPRPPRPRVSHLGLEGLSVFLGELLNTRAKPGGTSRVYPSCDMRIGNHAAVLRVGGDNSSDNRAFGMVVSLVAVKANSPNVFKLSLDFANAATAVAGLVRR